MSSAHEPNENVAPYVATSLHSKKRLMQNKKHFSAHVQPPSPNPLLESDCIMWFSEQARVSHLMPDHKSTILTLHHTCS